MSSQGAHHGRGIADQIRRYRTAFIAVVTIIVIAVFVGGYVLVHERLPLPGESTFVLKADFSSASAIAPGQGQAITIAGAKIGEVAAVELRHGVAEVTMDITPKYARYIYRNATLLLRPKTQLKDMTIEIDPGSRSSGRIKSGYTFGLANTAPDIDFDKFLAALDVETRQYLQALIAAAGEGLKHNGRALSAVFRRFDPITRDIERITSELQHRNVEIEDSIHNFQLLMSALGNKDKQIAEVVQSAQKVLGVFAKQDRAVEQTLHLLPGALGKTRQGLGKLTVAAEALGPALGRLHRFATALAPALKASRSLFKSTTPVIGNEIAPLTRQITPVLKKVTPATKQFDEALPKLQSSFAVINEFFNELAYNPSPKQAGFLFFLLWADHDFNSAVSSADANGPVGRTLLYLNCEVASILGGIAEVNPDVRLLIGLLKPPERAECEAKGLPVAGSATAAGSSAARGKR
jgi:phospholipid/cholesterol/gamma-HCH transport system substrate-binding protein